MSRRYLLTAPTPGGNAWWDIHDTESVVFAVNDSVASFAESLPNAQAEATALCYRLNTGSRKVTFS